MPKDIVCNAHYCVFYAQPIRRIDARPAKKDSRERIIEQDPVEGWPMTDEQIESLENKKYIIKRK